MAAPGQAPRHARPAPQDAPAGPHRHRAPGTVRLTRRGRLTITTTVALVVVGTVAGVLSSVGGGRHPARSVVGGMRAEVAVRPGTPGGTPSTSVPLTAAGVPVAVTQAVTAAGGDLSVAVYDAVTGRTWTYRDESGRVEASVSKLDVLGAELRAQQAGATETAGIADDETAMIEHSDNDAAADLYDVVGQDGIEDFDEAAGADDVQYASGGLFGLDTSTALDQVQIMKAFAYPGTVLTTASQAEAKALFDEVESDQHWGASGGVPAGVSVDLKNGWLPHGAGWVVNTVGHVSGEGHDYVVAILSAGNSTEQAGIDRLDAVSAAVWATSGG